MSVMQKRTDVGNKTRLLCLKQHQGQKRRSLPRVGKNSINGYITGYPDGYAERPLDLVWLRSHAQGRGKRGGRLWNSAVELDEHPQGPTASRDQKCGTLAVEHRQGHKELDKKEKLWDLAVGSAKTTPEVHRLEQAQRGT